MFEANYNVIIREAEINISGRTQSYLYNFTVYVKFSQNWETENNYMWISNI